MSPFTRVWSGVERRRKRSLIPFLLIRADVGRVVLQEVARTAGRIVRVGRLADGRAGIEVGHRGIAAGVGAEHAAVAAGPAMAASRLTTAAAAQHSAAAASAGGLAAAPAGDAVHQLLEATAIVAAITAAGILAAATGVAAALVRATAGALVTAILGTAASAFATALVGAAAGALTAAVAVAATWIARVLILPHHAAENSFVARGANDFGPGRRLAAGNVACRAALLGVSRKLAGGYTAGGRQRDDGSSYDELFHQFPP